jgi:hypothetical protein
VGNEPEGGDTARSDCAASCAGAGADADASPQTEAALKSVTSLTINGTLNYQACDDRVCFTPQTVALTWSVSLRQLDRERAKP